MAIADSMQVATLKAAKVAGRIIASAQRLVEPAQQAESGPLAYWPVRLLIGVKRAS
jgi:hypothetical protein